MAGETLDQEFESAPEVEAEDDTLSAALAVAWDEAESREDTAAPEPEDAAEVEPTPVPEEADAEPAPLAAEKKAAPEEVKTDMDVAPVGLSPAAREAWKDTPKAMKDAIAKRERDFAVGIQQYAENAKRAEMMDRTLAPYQQYMSMNGGPARSLQGLLQTGAALQMGSPMQKAQIVANLVKQFGVDINALDNALVGEAPPRNLVQQDEVTRRVQEALQPYQQVLQSVQSNQRNAATAQQQQVQDEVTQFSNDPANEFYRDVRGDMADILDLAAKRGVQMTLKDAYNRACKINPDVSQILETRALQQQMPGKRRAASSIRAGGPGGPGGGSSSNSIRSDIEDAWDRASRV